MNLNEIRKKILSFESPTIVHHYDADGISAAAIIEMFLEEHGKNVEKISFKVLNDENISKIKDIPEKIVVDFGTNDAPNLGEAIIIDHHTPRKQYPNVLNPHYYGIDGSVEISTSGLASLVVGSHEEIGILGATGDRQKFIGKNKELLDRALEKEKIIAQEDLKLFGKHYRPIHTMLTYYFPDFLLNPKQVFSFLRKANVPIKRDGKWLTYEDLTLEEKERLVSAVVEKALYMWGLEKIDEVYGTAYIIKPWDYEIRELATIVNATGRQGKTEVGIRICKGDLKAFQEGLNILKKHQKEVAKGLRLAETDLEEYENFYLLDGRGKVSDTVIGVVISIIEKNYRKPVVGMALDGDYVKLSIRSSQVHVGKVIEKVLEEVNGIGGGHESAGGAHIDPEHLEHFLKSLNKHIKL